MILELVELGAFQASIFQSAVSTGCFQLLLAHCNGGQAASFSSVLEP